MTITDFIDLELVKLDAYFTAGDYSQEKAEGAAAILSQLAVFIEDFDRLKQIALLLGKIRNDERGPQSE